MIKDSFNKFSDCMTYLHVSEKILKFYNTKKKRKKKIYPQNINKTLLIPLFRN